MKGKALGVVKSKLLRPCKRLLWFFRFKPKKPVFIRALKFRAHKSTFPKAFPTKPKMSSLLQSLFRSPKKSKHASILEGLKSPSNVHETPLFPSPLTPACVRAHEAEKSHEASRQEVDDACRSFENYLVEMIVEEGKTRDLMDVEELLYCWRNLKCPVFIDLVSRFYGELCKDLFSPDADEGDCSK
ncbi:transcription repressor OFP17 isoform X1 [Cajanus cajan]|uniref:transcription repressor OFP17 isoform X2 n=1 Tax=Cajanus cajan TaxID=3821 RepID=UPI00098DA17E|nr:transcription repressor OFP17 isoform X2 [Cajanus cajan]XP_020210697.1 transcription repressor OFP17 isoform X1 [Cajanus cajan]